MGDNRALQALYPRHPELPGHPCGVVPPVAHLVRQQR